jgi:cytochrome b561
MHPILGWLGASIYGATLNFFWIISIPPLFAKNVPLAESLLAVHSVLGLVMAAALCLHIGAAFLHYFILKDRVLQRMTGAA